METDTTERRKSKSVKREKGNKNQEWKRKKRANKKLNRKKSRAEYRKIICKKQLHQANKCEKKEK